MSRKDGLVLALLAAVASLAVLSHALRHGTALALSPDSVAYLSAARALAAGQGLVQYDGEPFVQWPPLYPFLLGGFESSGVGALLAGAWLQWAALAGLAVILGWAVWSRTGSAVRALAAAGTVLASRPLWHTAAFLWSEPLFCLFVAAALLLVARFRESREPAILAALVSASALACLTRHAGIFLVATVALLLLRPDGRRAVQRLRSAALYAGLSLLPAAASWLSNAAGAGAWAGERVGAGPHAFQDLRLFAETLANWVVPWSLPFEAKALVAALALAGLALAAWRAVLRDRRLADTVLAFGLFAVIYAGSLLGLGFVTAFDPPGDRLLSPLYAPLAGLAAIAWPRAAATRRWAGAAALALVLLWGARSGVVASRSVDWQLRHEETLASARWRDSALAAWLAREAGAARLYSDQPHAVYLYAGRHCRQAPRRHYFRAPNQPVADLERFTREVEAGGQVLVAWFEGDEGSYLYSPDEYPRPLRAERLREFEDGSVYRVTAESRSPE